MKKAKFHLTVAVAFLLGSIASTLTVLAHGGDIDLIHACVKSNNGSIRIVAANAVCANNETPLDWRIQGEPGPAGPPGTSGLSGMEIVWASEDEPVTEGAPLMADALCPSGKIAIAGGSNGSNGGGTATDFPIGPGIPVQEVGEDWFFYTPSDGSIVTEPIGWRAINGTNSGPVAAFAICVNASP